MVRSIRLCLARRVNDVIEKPTPVASWAQPVPSRSRCGSILVSAVAAMCAVRAWKDPTGCHPNDQKTR
jgi:hypothetical protein